MITGGEGGDAIGIGAILGAPFMLSTLAIFVCGVSVLIFSWRKRRTIKISFNREIMRRDLGFFLVAYTIAVAVGVFDIGRFRWAVAVLLIIGYGVYVRRTMRSEGDLQGECRALYFHRTAESPDLPQGDPPAHRGARRHHLRGRSVRAAS